MRLSVPVPQKSSCKAKRPCPECNQFHHQTRPQHLLMFGPGNSFCSRNPFTFFLTVGPHAKFSYRKSCGFVNSRAPPLTYDNSAGAPRVGIVESRRRIATQQMSSSLDDIDKVS